MIPIGLGSFFAASAHKYTQIALKLFPAHLENVLKP